MNCYYMFRLKLAILKLILGIDTLRDRHALVTYTFTRRKSSYILSTRYK
jgi:hypothetical protein